MEKLTLPQWETVKDLVYKFRKGLITGREIVDKIEERAVRDNDSEAFRAMLAACFDSITILP
jgi:hypothetical protein